MYSFQNETHAHFLKDTFAINLLCTQESLDGMAKEKHVHPSPLSISVVMLF